MSSPWDKVYQAIEVYMANTEINSATKLIYLEEIIEDLNHRRDELELVVKDQAEEMGF